MVLQNYRILIEMTSNIIDILAFGVGFKCPRKIHLITQCPVLISEAASPDRLDGSYSSGK